MVDPVLSPKRKRTPKAPPEELLYTVVTAGPECLEYAQTVRLADAAKLVATVICVKMKDEKAAVPNPGVIPGPTAVPGVVVTPEFGSTVRTVTESVRDECTNGAVFLTPKGDFCGIVIPVVPVLRVTPFVGVKLTPNP